MSKFDKLLPRFLAKPKDFTYNELKKLLAGFGYVESIKGKTAGSRVSFVNPETKHIISLHKPRPQKELKRYQMEYLENELKKQGLIK